MKYNFCNITDSIIMYAIGPMQYILSLELVFYYTVLSLFHILHFSIHGMHLYLYLLNHPTQTYDDGQVYCVTVKWVFSIPVIFVFLIQYVVAYL